MYFAARTFGVPGSWGNAIGRFLSCSSVSSSELLNSSLESGVQTVTLSAAKTRNALSLQMMEELRGAVHQGN